MSIPLGSISLLRGARTIPFAVRIRQKEAWITMFLRKAGKVDKMLFTLGTDQVWRGQDPTAALRNAFLLGKKSAEIASNVYYVGRIWLSGMIITSTSPGLENPKELRTALLMSRELFRGLILGGIRVEIDLETYLGNFPQPAQLGIFFSVLDPLERCGARLLYPNDIKLREQFLRALLWDSKLPGEASLSYAGTDASYMLGVPHEFLSDDYSLERELLHDASWELETDGKTS